MTSGPSFPQGVWGGDYPHKVILSPHAACRTIHPGTQPHHSLPPNFCWMARMLPGKAGSNQRLRLFHFLCPQRCNYSCDPARHILETMLKNKTFKVSFSITFLWNLICTGTEKMSKLLLQYFEHRVLWFTLKSWVRGYLLKIVVFKLFFK